MQIHIHDKMDSVPDMKPRKRKHSDQENIVSEVFNDYCASTSIHGIGYLGAKDKNVAEKVWWIIVVILSVISCCYLISKTWVKWQNNPVILSFEQEQTPVWKIPFPAVTICPVKKIMQFNYNYTEKFRERDELKNETDFKKFWDISLICSLEQYNIELNCSLNITDKEVFENIRGAAQNLESVIASLKWQGEEHMDPEYFFSEQITQEGICFTFNSFSQNDMYTKALSEDIAFIDHDVENSGWKLEDGYPPGISIMDNHPKRTAKDGSGSGLTVKLLHFSNYTDLVCGPMISGYKVILHNPAETPRPAEQYFLVPLKRKVAFTVKPELTTTSENLRFMTPSARKCYFSNEKSLRFYKVYTQNNCQTECAVNVTQRLCGCVPFYMPHDNETLICGFGKMSCVSKAEIQILMYQMLEQGEDEASEIIETEPYMIYDKCDCLPSCSDLQFTAETSQTESLAVETLIATGIYDNDTYITDFLKKEGFILTYVDIFYKESQFLALHRSELYGQTDFLANCGGLLGLFMGFSLLSLIEIFYFSTIRLWIKWRNRERKIA